MTQYLISAHTDGSNSYAGEEERQRAFAQVDAFDTELNASGSWVIAGGLTAPSDAAVVEVRPFQDEPPAE